MICLKYIMRPLSHSVSIHHLIRIQKKRIFSLWWQPRIYFLYVHLWLTAALTAVVTSCIIPKSTFVPFAHLHSIFPPPTPFLWSLLWVWFGFALLCFLVSPYKWDHTVFVFLFCLILHSVMPSESFQITADVPMARFLLFILNNSTVCVYSHTYIRMYVCVHTYAYTYAYV